MQIANLASVRIKDIMTSDPVSVGEGTSVGEAARIIREKNISCVLVARDEKLVGLLTTSDLSSRVLAEGLGADTPVSAVMTPNPLTLKHNALVLDAFKMMVGRGIGHFPVLAQEKLVGIVTRTTMLKMQSLSPLRLMEQLQIAKDEARLKAVVDKAPKMLAQLNSAGLNHKDVTRYVTDITDALTVRLIELAEERLGPAPAPYLWLACGSQGRQEQTGVSDQDNCIIMADNANSDDKRYFEELAKTVCDGLNECGFVYCPGDMMATNERWRQPAAVWRQYFQKWVDKPDPMAQMLTSVMFDLRSIHGDASLFKGIKEETLKKAKANSIFIAHMTANSLKHRPALGMFGMFRKDGKGEHKGCIDLKHGGVVPIIDLARLYAIRGGLTPVNTKNRLSLAIESGLSSKDGGRNLVEAFDLIASIRIDHQAKMIRLGEKPSNFVSPETLSGFERGHLKEAFKIVRTMQEAAGQFKGVL